MNIKRQRDNIDIKLGTFDITKFDLVNLEKIIPKRIEPMDHFVKLGKSIDLYGTVLHTYSSARYIPKLNRIFHRAEIRTKAPNVSVYFGLRSTRIVVQLMYSKGDVLKQLRATANELEEYLSHLEKDKKHPLSRLIHRNTIRL